MEGLQKRPATAVLVVAALMGLGAAACSPSRSQAAQPEVKAMPISPPPSRDLGKSFTAPLVDAKGKVIGDAVFTEGAHGLIIRLTAQPGKLTPGWHGLHLHEKADCADASAGFKASGKHAGHGDSVQHGFLAPGGPEPGDLPNLFVAPKAPVGGEFVSTMATLSNETQGGRIPLLDADGSALIVHANPDDMKTQPVGNAGDRVACAAIPPAPSAP